MIKQFLSLTIFTIISFNCYSQIVYENGYFINESNEKIACLIKNNDWKNNPTEFEYKLDQNSEIKKAGIQSVKEFGINGVSKYIRASVKIDRSADDINNISNEKDPIFREESLFLKILIEGKASLFLYERGNLTRFFYRINDSEIDQLVYKRYLANGKTFVKNNYFKQQLFDLKCQDITRNEIEGINYNERDLKQFFVKYNECSKSIYSIFETKKNKDIFNLTIRPGLSIDRPKVFENYIDTDFNFRFGVETEFIFPYNKNKWAIIFEPSYQYFKYETQTEFRNVYGGILITNIDYKSIELPLGIRHYFFLEKNSKIFVNASCLIDFCSNSQIVFTRSDGSEFRTLEIKSGINFAIGMGYKYKDKYSLEMRYQTRREVYHSLERLDCNALSFIFGFSLF